MSKLPRTYRKNVAALIINDFGCLLMCERADRNGAWQIPQGGVERGESVETALYRELREEIGTDSIEIIGTLPKPIRYDWPEHVQKNKGYRGQEQTYFLVRLQKYAKLDFHRHAREEKDGTAEFSRGEWLPANEFLKRISGFKEGAYRTALSAFQDMFPGLIALE